MTVWITGDVNLPMEVVEAHAEGRLVFFVGAGASLDAPSGLPSFKKLARQLADRARVPFDEESAIDSFLGSMPTTFETHTHAQRIIARADSTHNSTHSAIIRVVSTIGPMRLVTTNFDDHLAAAAAADSVDVDDKWFGPALPLGDTFTGIVHLHGSVLRAPSELVLTDRDFGRAYLTDAWATRFLQRMFDSFTVLFVGYSHDDPIMRYLSLGLPSRTRRYVLTHQPDDEKWSHLGIEPIGYPVNDSDHSALVAALEAWDRRARMGRLEHRTRMREIVEAGPFLTPIDHDYLTSRLRTVDGVREFVGSAGGIEWLNWAESLPEFQGLFNGRADSDTASVLGNWFCSTFIADPQTHGAALQTLQRLGQSFSDGFFLSANWAAGGLCHKDETAGRRWKTFLATSVHGQSAPANLDLPPDDRSEHKAVLRVALRPFLALKQRWWPTDDDRRPPDADLRWHTDEHALTQHLLKLVADSDAGDPALGALLEDALNGAHDLLAGYHGDNRLAAPNVGRSAIEPHPQDEFRDSIDGLIDALRDYGEKALPAMPDLPERWWAFGHALFRRLALHLIATDTSHTSDSRLQWILDRDLLYEIDVKHEAYRVLAVNVGTAGPSLRATLLADVLTGPDFPDGVPDRDRHAAYSTYNLLVWLVQHATYWEDAATALRDIQTANPTFAPREHPDFDTWASGGVWGETLPIEPEDFIRSAETNLEQAFEDLLNHDYSAHRFDGPTWEDALSVVRRVAEKQPDLGRRLWDLVDQRDDLETRADHLRCALVGGWERADLGDLAETISVLVASQVPNPECARPIGLYLRSQIVARIESEESRALAAMRQLARDLWREQSDRFTHAEGSDPSFNSWPGDVASYWLTEIDRRWRKNSDDWTGLNDVECEALLELLSGPSPTLDATRPALTRQTFFLFAADAPFTEANVLPLFRDDSTAAQAWGSFLYHPRYDDRLLDAGFLDSVVVEWDRLDGLGDKGLQNQFYGMVISILTFSGISARDRQRLLDQSVLSSDGIHAAPFAAQAVSFLRIDDVDGAQVWDLWLRDHLTARLDGLPRTPRSEELARWADAVPYLGNRIPEAVELLKGRSIGLGDNYRAPELPAPVLNSYGPQLVDHLSDRVLNSSPSGWLSPPAVRKTIEAVRDGLGSNACQPLIDAAAERGFVSDGQTLS